jgi:hypothetical protein
MTRLRDRKSRIDVQSVTTQAAPFRYLIDIRALFARS